MFYPGMEMILQQVPLHPNAVWLQVNRFGIIPRFSAKRVFEMPGNVFDGSCTQLQSLRSADARTALCRQAFGQPRYTTECTMFLTPYHLGVSLYNLPHFCGFKQSREKYTPESRKDALTPKPFCEPDNFMKLLRTPCPTPQYIAREDCLASAWHNSQSVEDLFKLGYTLPRVVADVEGFRALEQSTVVVPRDSTSR